jgi:hypothetical protein
MPRRRLSLSKQGELRYLSLIARAPFEDSARCYPMGVSAFTLAIEVIVGSPNLASMCVTHCVSCPHGVTRGTSARLRHPEPMWRDHTSKDFHL